MRRNTDYTDLLHQILLDYHFMPIGQGLDSQVLCYAHSVIPMGYHINYTEARQLWKQWWVRSSRRGNRNLQLDLFVLTQNQWYPVRDIAINSGTFYIETLRGETIHYGDDMMVWLEKDSAEAGEKTRFWASTAAKEAPVTPAAAVESAPSEANSRSISSPSASSTLASMVCTREGKVYVKTALGVVVIEGDNLKAYGLAPRTAAVSIRQQR